MVHIQIGDALTSCDCIWGRIEHHACVGRFQFPNENLSFAGVFFFGDAKFRVSIQPNPIGMNSVCVLRVRIVFSSQGAAAAAAICFCPKLVLYQQEAKKNALCANISLPEEDECNPFFRIIFISNYTKLRTEKKTRIVKF